MSGFTFGAPAPAPGGAPAPAGMHGHRALEGTFLGGCVISARVAAASAVFLVYPFGQG